MDKSERIKELIDILNEAGKVYYSGTDEIMSNFEYDRFEAFTKGFLGKMKTRKRR